MSGSSRVTSDRGDDRAHISRHDVTVPAPLSAPHDLPGLFRYLQRAAGNAAVNGLVREYARNQGVARPGLRGRPTGNVYVQRYQAGIRGHGGIEQEGLAEAGFAGSIGEGEIGAIYFGNWLRDWSQVNPGPSSRWYPLVMDILNILAMGEFNHPMNASDLGGYLPSEHLDNPLGGKSSEDPIAKAKDKADATSTLSDEQKKALKREQTPEYKQKIEAASKASGLPDYIERGKDHSKQKLEEAVHKEKTPEGMMALGNALHVVEDYFAHSNFTEVALSFLATGGNKGAGDILDRAKEDGFDAVAAGGPDLGGPDAISRASLKSRGPAIITGTYGDESHSANKVVSIIEQLKSEVLTGALRRAFVLGSARLSGRRVAGIGKSTVGSAGGVIGAGVETVGGGILGAAKGLVGGYEGGHGFIGTLEHMASGLLSGGRHGMVVGGEKGAAEGEQLGGELGQDAGNALGEIVGATEAATLLAAAQPLFAALEVAVHLELDQKISNAETKKSAVGAPGGLPTHSQLAKDADEHPVFETSRALAVEADRIIGQAMREAWQNPDKRAAVKSVTSLVDKIVSYPTADTWWRPVLDGVLGRYSSPR